MTTWTPEDAEALRALEARRAAAEAAAAAPPEPAAGPELVMFAEDPGPVQQQWPPVNGVGYSPMLCPGQDG